MESRQVKIRTTTKICILLLFYFLIWGCTQADKTVQPVAPDAISAAQIKTAEPVKERNAPTSIPVDNAVKPATPEVVVEDARNLNGNLAAATKEKPGASANSDLASTRADVASGPTALQSSVAEKPSVTQTVFPRKDDTAPVPASSDIQAPEPIVHVPSKKSLPAEAKKAEKKNEEVRPEGSLKFKITGFSNNQGSVRVLLFNRQEGFPADHNKALRMSILAIDNGEATGSFEHLDYGVYAISVLHDENNNKKLDTNFFGIPQEGTGVSNNARGFLGPPKFKAAQVDLRQNEMDLAISINY